MSGDLTGLCLYMSPNSPYEIMLVVLSFPFNYFRVNPFIFSFPLSVLFASSLTSLFLVDNFFLFYPEHVILLVPKKLDPFLKEKSIFFVKKSLNQASLVKNWYKIWLLLSANMFFALPINFLTLKEKSFDCCKQSLQPLIYQFILYLLSTFYLTLSHSFALENKTLSILVSK